LRKVHVNKLLIFPVILLLLFTLSSCKQGKWYVNIKYIFYDDGGSLETYRVFPANEDAKKDFNSAMEKLKSEYRNAEITQERSGNQKCMIIKRKLLQKDNFSLKKISGKWVFRHQNRFPHNVETRKIEAIMPGWITKTNADYSYCNYSKWESPFSSREFMAESTVLPFIYVVGLAVLIIVIILGAIAFLFIYRRSQRTQRTQRY